MLSVKDGLVCIGRDPSGTVSVLRHLLGFFRARVPNDGSSSPTVSLKSALDGLENRKVNINVILVGWVNEYSAADAETGLRKIDFAVMRTREIFDQVNLAVGRVDYSVLDRVDARGYDNIGSAGEADDLSDEWSVRNDGIDCFIPETISANNFIGVSPCPGDCDKGGKSDGLVAGAIDRGGSVGASFNGFARTFAHEIGHYLGLPHNHGSQCPTGGAANNLMAQTRCNLSPPQSAVGLTTSQGSTMRGHCTTRLGCRRI